MIANVGGDGHVVEGHAHTNVLDVCLNVHLTIHLCCQTNVSGFRFRVSDFGFRDSGFELFNYYILSLWSNSLHAWIKEVIVNVGGHGDVIEGHAHAHVLDVRPHVHLTIQFCYKLIVINEFNVLFHH